MQMRRINKLIRGSVLSALSLTLSLFLLFYPDTVSCGPYLDSAHGNTSYGINRTSLSTFGYSIGNCVHCHEQHASIGGSEPNPTGGPDKYLLFYTNYVSQTDGFCFECHTDINSYQSGGSLVNRSYSYRAGGWTSDTLNDIKEAFSFTAAATSHNLGDIRTFINGRWGYTTDSNPCAACHNPHAAKGDPANSPNSTKSSTTRSYSPVSRPSLHSKDNNAWGLWGANSSSERMNVYAGGLYQAPYFYNSSATYEPDGSTTQDGSNLTDYVTLCTDCHNNSNSISSTTLGRNLKTIDWNVEKHGKGISDGTNWACSNITGFLSPYPTACSQTCTLPGCYITTGTCSATCPSVRPSLGCCFSSADCSSPNKVLTCTDCHEPHGAPNAVLLRKEVNGGVLSGQIITISTLNNRELGYICARCHKEDTPGSNTWANVHHNEYPAYGCGGSGVMCHGIVPNDFLGNTCSYCHYHGSVVTDAHGSKRTF
jgi:predicted CXXCH cytochrome family protein